MKRQSLLLFGGLLLAIPVAVQAQFNYTVTNQTITITGYTGTSSVVDIPSTINGLPVISIGAGAFAGSSITAVMIPNSVTTIGVGAFSECFYMTSVTIPNSLTSIGSSAFSGAGLTSVLIPNTVTNIGYGAFSGCNLTNVTIPDSVTTIGDGAFGACLSLTNITVEPLNSAYSSVDGVLFNHNQTTLVEYPGGKFGGYTIPNSVTSIGAAAFSDGRIPPLPPERRIYPAGRHRTKPSAA
jgi:hypothetical protein